MEKTAAEHKTDLDTFLGPTIAVSIHKLCVTAMWFNTVIMFCQQQCCWQHKLWLCSPHWRHGALRRVRHMHCAFICTASLQIRSYAACWPS